MLNVIICGAPGSGKGTQSDLIVEKFNLKHLSTGDLLREEIASNSEQGKQAEKLISNGQLVPDEMIVAILGKEVDKSIGKYNGLILDGFPRTISQAEHLEKMLAKHGMEVDVLLDIEVEENELIQRLLNRGKVSGRSDDNIDTIKKRLDVYHEKTKPLSDYYKKQEKYALINGQGNIQAIHKDIVDVLSKIEQEKELITK